MRNNLVTPAKKRKHSIHLFMEAVTYRSPLPVTRIIVYAHNDSYPICPRCSMSLDREYMSFGDRCGQKLSWHLLDHAIICYPESKKE